MTFCTGAYCRVAACLVVAHLGTVPVGLALLGVFHGQLARSSPTGCAADTLRSVDQTSLWPSYLASTSSFSPSSFSPPPNCISEGGRPERSLLLRGPSLWVPERGTAWLGCRVQGSEGRGWTGQMAVASIPHFLYPRQCWNVTALFP